MQLPNILIGLIVIFLFLLIFIYFVKVLRAPYLPIEILINAFSFKNSVINYKDIKFISLIVNFGENAKYLGRIKIDYIQDSIQKSLFIPLSVKVCNSFIKEYQNGISKDNLVFLLKNVPQEKVDSNLLEFIQKDKIDMNKVTSYLGFKLITGTKLEFWYKN